jgi:hypothetical protein
MRKLLGKENSIVTLLAQGGKMKGPELARRIGVDAKEVSRTICQMRRQFSRGNQNAVYVILTKDGYCLEEKPEHLHYEGARRMKCGTSLILNGAYIYKRYKAIALNDFDNLRITFVPAAIKTMEVMKQIKES